MIPQELIRRKRDGGVLTADEIAGFVTGMTDGSIAESQVSAFAMAVFFQGMTMDERVALTRCMMESGRRMDWADLDLGGPVLDKHSTGGVGDKVSLVLAPVIAALGGFVPMISGRGLGHTGGTLDKLESIPGYNATPDHALFRQTVKTAGCAVIGQTDDLAPADRRLYAIRDVTATVESIPLITASILSKKLAAGLDGLVMDVKTGSGAFAPTLAMAEELAGSIVDVAGGAGLPATAVITDMNQVLGSTAGNALEVRESVDLLTGRTGDPRLVEVLTELAIEMGLLGKLADGGNPRADLRGKVAEVLGSGAAAEHFGRMVAALGGPADFVEKPERYLGEAPVRHVVTPSGEGYVANVDTRAVGIAVIELGGGRRRVTDSIDHAVGLDQVRGIGEKVGPDQPLCVIHARDEDSARRAEALVLGAVRVQDDPLTPSPVIVKHLRGEAV